VGDGLAVGETVGDGLAVVKPSAKGSQSEKLSESVWASQHALA
jgi:hypothetical protein